MKNQSKFIPIRDYYNEKLNFTLPRNISTMFIRDPKAVLFILARHKFVAKVLKDKKKILDVGCGEGFGTSFIAGINQHQKFLGVDRIQDNIDDANDCLKIAMAAARGSVIIWEQVSKQVGHTPSACSTRATRLKCAAEEVGERRATRVE